MPILSLLRGAGSNPGKAWNQAIDEVDTPYVLIGRDLTSFDENLNLDRMVS